MTDSHAPADGLQLRRATPLPPLAHFGLIALDMDSTLITIECIDEIAAAVGLKAQVAAITEATMRGEIADFRESLLRRVALLKGVPEGALQEVYDTRLRLTPGAEQLLEACKDAGLKTLLVSGGFTFFAERLRARLGLDFVRSNRLEVVDGVLTGRVLPQAWGDVCDGAVKRATLLDVASLLGLDPARTIAVGDGSNDIPMMQAAGLSVAFHAKPRVREVAEVSIDTGGLERLLDVLG
ncbi:phosphoserine phosphatase SerB [Pseudoxanthomonas winnipegensis]|uniref:Phosphoserine phosphatase n=1 Tax=Pseudoxanthomonas winnipegensis TaxID=2480810 RepID=A0A4Q8LUT9_9GAMM|nr:phosphoserine phosphatase SerB [Pseudoxanthomonas winnipegensis]RZZ85455.1 phosphoserine phosphatase SerB [Pseudoxanthomonas winnipegensis]TAA35700.1 phosphoserine phosphatase SerB [Pseudoxanthomonas winnipegensis]